MRKIIVGVMGAGESASAIDRQLAFELGRAIAAQGWVLLTGGRNVGVMDAACRGAQQAGGLTIGILPDRTAANASAAVAIAICTGMGNARNAINVLSSDAVIACGMGAGTASEVAIALKEKKPVLLLGATDRSIEFFQQLGAVETADSIEQAIDWAKIICG
ncbi:TIGR00725 family protein [Microcoleus sp. FACHB-1515]|uniref:TIGR00725 family protein n=1 Tax=Cyanophyceae TaxID=3028117 RepID=UPI001686052A|nr:TIGR00725 family protein [Microcoleus sp. FACHB-1515]MBD2091771.1 TIGR00725 family protein [Microcoleus sp. FACHB-1515]